MGSFLHKFLHTDAKDSGQFARQHSATRTSSHEATSYITKNSTFVSHILKEHGPETGGEGDENVCGSSYTCNLTEYSIDS
jgi:hypothetical protein